MSTRAMFCFKDTEKTIFIYNHHDGYPSGAAQAISDAILFAWELPRFEADEFAAAFVAANKPRGGGIRIASSPDGYGVEYLYTVSMVDGKLNVKVNEYDYNLEKDEDVMATKPSFDGTLEAFIAWSDED